MIDTPIETMDDKEVIRLIDQLSTLAIQQNNLEIIFGSNGQRGRSATGNYTLIARRLGMTRSFIGRVLRGSAYPSFETLDSLSRITGISRDKISDYLNKKRREKKAA